MSLNDWNQWESCHSKSGQSDRQKRASTKKLTPFSLDVNGCCATFKGSGTELYKTSLSDCTCIDFHRRFLPCKHMYRLAYELGVYMLDSTVEKTSAPLLNKEEAMNLVQSSLTEEEQKAFLRLCYVCGNNNSGQSLVTAEFAEKLIMHNLAIVVTDVKILLSYLKMQEIRKRYLPAGCKSPRTKAELIEFVAPLVKKEDVVFDNSHVCVTLHPQIAHLGCTIHHRLCSIYPTQEEDWYFSN